MIARAVSLSLLATLSPTITVSAQLVIREALACAECRISAVPLTTLGSFDGPGALEGGVTRAFRDSAGRYFVHRVYGPVIDVFSADGRHIRTIGRQGDGPGEFREIARLKITAGDSLRVLDGARSVQLVFSPELDFVREFRLAVPPRESSDILQDGSVVINAPIRSPELVGSPVHRLDHAGRRIESIGGTSALFRPDVPYFDSRAVTAAHNGGVWIGYRNRYQVEHWIESERSMWVRADRTWFPDWHVPTQRSFNPATDAPRPYLQTIWEDADGLIWTGTLVAGPRWRDAIDRDGPHGVRVLDDAIYRHTIIETLDSERGLVLARITLPGTLSYVGANAVGGIFQSDEGVPFFHVWQLHFTSPQP